MIFYIKALLLALCIVDVPGSPTLNGIENSTFIDNINQQIETKLDLIFPRDITIETIKESVSRFVHNIEDLLEDIREEKSVFLDNLEDEKITRVFNKFNIPPCGDDSKLKNLKEAFSLRFSTLDLPLREAMFELKAKVKEIKRSLNLEKYMFELKLTVCELTDSSDKCIGTALVKLPCLNDTCTPAQHNSSMIGLNTTIKSTYSLPPRIRLSTECDNGKFNCQDGKCISMSWVCDGQKDCDSDEAPGCSSQCDSGIRCKNLKCLLENQICNGVDDCGDGTDEEKCVTKENCNLSSGGFACLEVPSFKSHCLPLELVCDGHSDCVQGQDEGENCQVIDGCERCAALGGACLRSPAGPLCLSDCPAGFLLDLQTGVCLHANSTQAKKIRYGSRSFVTIVNNIKILLSRFITGVDLLKKRMFDDMHKAMDDLKKCTFKTKGVVGSPFEIFV